MKIKKFEVRIIIPDDKDPENITAMDMLEVLRINNCDFGSEDCCIEVKEIKK
jgi:hypothetical protein